MKLNYSQKILAVSVIVLVCVLVLDLIFTRLLLGQIIDINDKIKQLDISSQERLKELVLKDSITSSEAARGELESYFVPAGDAATVTFTKYLEDLAKADSVTQSKTINYEPVLGMESSSIVSAIRFKFNISGSWANVFAFLQAIENLPNVALLNNVSLSVSSDTSTKTRVWSADIDFSVVKRKN